MAKTNLKTYLESYNIFTSLFKKKTPSFLMINYRMSMIWKWCYN